MSSGYSFGSHEVIVRMNSCSCWQLVKTSDRSCLYVTQSWPGLLHDLSYSPWQQSNTRQNRKKKIVPLGKKQQWNFNFSYWPL